MCLFAENSSIHSHPPSIVKRKAPRGGKGVPVRHHSGGWERIYAYTVAHTSSVHNGSALEKAANYAARLCVCVCVSSGSGDEGWGEGVTAGTE